MRTAELLSIPGRSKRFSHLYSVHASSRTSFFLFFWGGGGVRLSPLGMSAIICPSVPAPMKSCSRVREKPKYSEDTYSSATFVHHKSRMTWPDHKPGPPRCEAGSIRWVREAVPQDMSSGAESLPQGSAPECITESGDSFSSANDSPRRPEFMSRVWVTTDGVWFGNCTYSIGIDRTENTSPNSFIVSVYGHYVAMAVVYRVFSNGSTCHNIYKR
jgi:hypothetical protein